MFQVTSPINIRNLANDHHLTPSLLISNSEDGGCWQFVVCVAICQGTTTYLQLIRLPAAEGLATWNEAVRLLRLPSRAVSEKKMATMWICSVASLSFPWCLTFRMMQTWIWSHWHFNTTHLESIEKLPVEVNDVWGACGTFFTRITLRQGEKKT